MLIFNAKPTDKYTKKNSERVDDSTTNDTNRLEVLKEEKRDVIRKKNSKHHVMDSKDDHLDSAKAVDVEKKLKQKRQKTNDIVSEKVVLGHDDERRDGIRNKNSKHHLMDQSKDDPLDNAIDVDVEKQLKQKRQKTNNNVSEKEVLVCEDEKRDDIKRKNSKKHVKDGPPDNAKDVDVEKESRQKKQKNEKLSKKEVPVHGGVDGKAEKNLKKIAKMEQGELNILDDPEASFVELFAADTAENPKYDNEKKIVDKTIQDMNLVGGLVTFSVNKKKAKSHGGGPTMDLTPIVEVGMGGASTWGDE